MNLALLEPKSEIPTFKVVAHTGDTLSNDRIIGNASVISFFNTECIGSCEDKLANLERVQQQFFKTDRVRLITITTNPDADSLSVISDFAEKWKPVEGVWHFGNMKEKALTDNFVKQVFAGYQAGPSMDHFVLVDDSLRIRKYYIGTNKDSVDLMIRHLSMVMPREKKREIVYDPEKEK
ncbi:MAG: SCO family protein [Bacteroidota bacterium]